MAVKTRAMLLGALGLRSAEVEFEQDLNADLPSVMTCANYFKLPPFTSKATMAERIKVAMTEGAGSFALS